MEKNGEAGGPVGLDGDLHDEADTSMNIERVCYRYGVYDIFSSVFLSSTLKLCWYGKPTREFESIRTILYQGQTLYGRVVPNDKGKEVQYTTTSSPRMLQPED